MRYNMEESDLTVSSNVSGYHSLCMYCPCPIFDRFYFLIKWLMYLVVVYGSHMSSWFCATHDIYLNLDFLHIRNNCNIEPYASALHHEGTQGVL